MIVFEQDQDSVLQKVLGNILNINLPLVSASSLEHVGKKMKHVMKIIHECIHPILTNKVIFSYDEKQARKMKNICMSLLFPSVLFVFRLRLIKIRILQVFERKLL